MTQEQLNAFIANAKGNNNLQEKLKAAADVDTVIAITKEAGFSLSAGDFNKTQPEASDVELEGAAGGGFWCAMRGGGWVSYVCGPLSFVADTGRITSEYC